MKVVKNFFKKNYKEIIILIILTIFINYPLPYYIFTGGGTTSLNEKFKVEGGTTSKGSYNLSYVKEIKSTPLFYLLSYIVPEWERASIKDYQYNPEESLNEMALRDRMMLEHANRTAVSIAYKKADKEFKITKNKYMVIVAPKEKENVNIKIGDELISMNGEPINSLLEIRELIGSKSVGDKIEFGYLRGEKEYKEYLVIKDSNGNKAIGIGIVNLFDYEVAPKIEFNFSSSESGPSAGFMVTLAIYDSLIEEDLTNGLKIVGSGSIEPDGTITPIGGIKHKLVGAVKDDADIFFAPSGENYKEALRIKEKNNYKIDIVEVKSFDDAVEYLTARRVN